MSKESLNHVVIGALLDFADFLTSKPKEECLILSSVENATPMVKAVEEFLERERIEDCDPSPQWQSRCTRTKPLLRYVVRALDKMKSSLKRFITITNPEEEEGVTPIVSFQIQSGPIGEVGLNGCQHVEMIEFVKCLIQLFNKNVPCRENDMSIIRLDEALKWQELRTIVREKNGVEGFDKPTSAQIVNKILPVFNSGNQLSAEDIAALEKDDEDELSEDTEDEDPAIEGLQNDSSYLEELKLIDRNNNEPAPSLSELMEGAAKRTN
jgi:hypothetical protein